MDFTLGRAGLSTASGGDSLELKCSAWSEKGDVCTASGVIRGQSSVADVNALRRQLAGYDLNTDEPVVPVTWVQDPSVDGFYRVQGVEVGPEVTGRQRAAADGAEIAYRWSVDLLRAPGWQAPLFEVICTGAVRSNGHSVTSASTLAWVGLPVSGSDNLTPSLGSSASRTSAEGAAVIVYDSAETLFDSAITYFGLAANHYKGSSRVEYSPDSGSTWRSVVGRQVTNSAVDVRVSNGLVRATVTSAGLLSVAHYDGSGWDTAKTYYVDYGGSDHDSLGGWVTVLRNSPEAVTVRFGLDVDPGATLSPAPYLDLTLRRGAYHVEGYYWAGASGALGFRRASVEPSTALTGAIRATSNDASGNRFIAALAPATTNDLVNGAVNLTASATGTAFMVGSEVGGSGASGGNTAQNIVYQWLAAVNHRQRITAR